MFIIFIYEYSHICIYTHKSECMHIYINMCIRSRTRSLSITNENDYNNHEKSISLSCLKIPGISQKDLEFSYHATISASFIMENRYNKQELDISKKESDSSILNTNKNDSDTNNNDDNNKNENAKNNPTTKLISNSILELELLFCRNVPSDFIQLIKNIVGLMMRFSKCDYHMEAELFCLDLSEKLIQIIEKLYQGKKCVSIYDCMYMHI
jgi:hypothetical protein